MTKTDLERGKKIIIIITPWSTAWPDGSTSSPKKGKKERKQKKTKIFWITASKIFIKKEDRFLYGTEKPCCPHPKKEALNKILIYTSHTRWKNRIIKSFLAGYQIWFKYSSIFQVFIVLIIQAKGTKKVALMFQKRKAEKLRPSTSFSTAVASFQFITSNRDALSQMNKPSSLMALCPEINYYPSTGYILS